MLAAIAGGRLQGVELACLAKKAGWQTLLIDRDPKPPALNLCDRFVQLDLGAIHDLDAVCAGVDIVIPALEDREVLSKLARWGRNRGMPVAFDEKAYAVTCSKIESNRLFASLGVDAPEPWPACGYPAVTKPGGASGSHGVVILNGPDDLARVFPRGIPEQGWVCQQYLDGPSFSLELIGRPGDYQPLVCTELFMDAVHDCKSVSAPCSLTRWQIRDLEEMAVALAEAVVLTGIMDLEVILHKGRFKALEIDARFPSQTPLAVNAATGCNMLEMLGALFLSGQTPKPAADELQGARLAHIRVTPETIFLEGEHIMGLAGPLDLVTGFYGADEAITNFREGARYWVATLIVTGQTREATDRQFDRVLAAIQDDLEIDAIVDRNPESGL
jgi:pyrrolysine biosynthesis protein PylC